MLKIKYYCGLSLDLNQERECEGQGIIELDDDDIEEYHEGFYSMVCPSCKRELHQSDDHFEFIDEMEGE